MTTEKDAEIERLRMQVVACGVLARCNTHETLARNRQMHEDYVCDSVQAVIGCVEREIAEREAKESAEDEVARLRGMILAGQWTRQEGRSYLSVRVADNADLSCRATREDALNAALAQPEQPDVSSQTSSSSGGVCLAPAPARPRQLACGMCGGTREYPGTYRCVHCAPDPGPPEDENPATDFEACGGAS